MVVHKRKKNTRQRGSHTHGWGSKKKHRGAGNRGGRGMAGTGKRADAKKPSVWKDKKYFGSHGFKSKSKKDIKSINLSFFEENLDKLIADKKAEQKEGFYIIDISKIGYDKLLSCGEIKHKFKFIAKYASKKAIEKVKKSGGDIVLSTNTNTSEQG